ncbi:MAG: YcgN family cysteine cluster protein [Henriciella sp.]|nr:YcgN family cysteine cluster protein [Henriciella sp.]
MNDAVRPFWETKSLEEMNQQEWESLCDGCAKCCLLKLEDEDTGDIAYTRLHCRLLDEATCRCSNYPERKRHVPDCVILTPQSVSELKWMPKTCAYRLLHEGKPLPDWHHLISQSRATVHAEGHSIQGMTVSEDTVFEEDQMDWIVDWEGNEP